MSPRVQRRLLALILAGYVTITLLYGLVNPLFEAPDEHWHYFTVDYIAENGRLPTVAPGDNYDKWLSQEAAQPPLAYIAGALLIAPIDRAGARETLWPNKFASVGDASDLINLNRFVHSQQEKWPWNGYVLAAHLLRVFSTLLGLGTLLAIYLSGRLIWPKDPGRALLAAALVAFLPQFNFVHAAVSNDPLIIFLVSFALWQLVRLWQTEVTRGRLLLLGLTIGLATLTKNAGITLLLYSVGFLVLLSLRDWQASTAVERSGQVSPGGWRLVGETVVFVVLPASLLGGWLWARNMALYGDPTATNQFIRLAGGDRNYTAAQVLRETRGLWLSLIAVFGWFNVRAPQWVYWLWSAMVAVAAFGAGWRGISRWRRKQESPSRAPSEDSLWQRLSGVLQQGWALPFLLSLWVAAVYGSLFLFMLRTEAAQGRLLFPALLPLALGMASGLTATKSLRRFSPLFVIGALVTAVYCLFFVIPPTYELPETLLELPPEVTLLDVDMGQGIRLVGAQVETSPRLPGDELWMTLYWRADEPSQPASEFALSLFGRDLAEVAKVHSYHGRGLYPSGLWPSGRIVADRFATRIDDEVHAPVLAQLEATIIGGNSTQAGEVKIVPAAWPRVDDQTLARLGEAIGIVSLAVSPEQARPGDSLEITVTWRAVADPVQNLTTLLHLGQPDEPPLATGDQLPLGGAYPTRAWAAGEVIADSYQLQLPDELAAGRYPIWIGMYDTAKGDRLPVTIAAEPQPFDVYLAGWVDVE